MGIRIAELDLPGNYVNGQILHGSDLNRVINVLREGVNYNKQDLDKMFHGADSDFVFESIEARDDYELSISEGQYCLVMSDGVGEDTIGVYKYTSGAWVYDGGISMLDIYLRGKHIEETMKGDKGVSFRFNGAWDPDAPYVNDADYIDIVRYSGDTYACKLSIGTTGNSDPVTDTSHWELHTKQGSTFRMRGEWGADTPYYVDDDHIDTVSYLGDVYYCKLTIETTGNSNPTVDTTHWGLYIEKGISFRVKGAWDEDASYINDSSFIDVVYFSGKAYACSMSVSTTGNEDPSKDALHWELFLDNTMGTELDSASTSISYTLVDNEDKSFSQPVITSVSITVPSTASHGFVCSVNYFSGASPATVAFTNSSAFTLKVIKFGFPVITYTPDADVYVTMMFFCDGLNIYCYILEAE